MPLGREEFLSILLGWFFCMWALHVCLDEVLGWKPKVYLDSAEKFSTWTEYQMRATRSLYPKGCGNKTRIQKSASERLVFIASEVVLLCGVLYSFAFESDTWKHVFHGKQRLGNWPAIDRICVVFFVTYLYEVATRTHCPIQWPAAAHHFCSLIASAKVLIGGSYFTVAVWYAVCGVSLQIPVNVGIIMFARYAPQFPEWTRAVLRFSYWWYLATACIANAVGTLVIVAGYFRHGSYVDGCLALLCVVVWANDDNVYLKWLRRVSEIEYGIGTNVNDIEMAATPPRDSGTKKEVVTPPRDPTKIDYKLAVALQLVKTGSFDFNN